MAMKLMVAARRRPGMSRRAYADYVEHIHGGIVAAGPPDFLDLHHRYRQNHVLDAMYGSGVSTEYDSVSELWFADLPGMRQATQHPYYRSTVAPDEPKFGNQSNLIVLMISEEVVKEGDETGGVKVMHFAYRSPAVDRDGLTDLVRSVVRNDARFSNVVLSCPIPLPRDAGGDFAGGIATDGCDVVISFVSPPDQVDAVHEFLASALEGAGDATRSFSLVVRDVTILAARARAAEAEAC